MLVYILRHGDAESFAASDEQRQLSPIGRDNAGHVGSALKGIQEREMLAFNCLASPYLRARQTAEIVRGYLGLTEEQLCDSLTPDAEPSQTLASISRQVVPASGRALLLVSHQPLVTRLIEYFVKGTSGRGSGEFPPMYTSSLACLEFDPEIGPNAGCFDFHWVKSWQELQAG